MIHGIIYTAFITLITWAYVPTEKCNVARNKCKAKCKRYPLLANSYNINQIIHVNRYHILNSTTSSLSNDKNLGTTKLLSFSYSDKG